MRLERTEAIITKQPRVSRQGAPLAWHPAAKMWPRQGRDGLRSGTAATRGGTASGAVPPPVPMWAPGGLAAPVAIAVAPPYMPVPMGPPPPAVVAGPASPVVPVMPAMMPQVAAATWPDPYGYPPAAATTATYVLPVAPSAALHYVTQRAMSANSVLVPATMPPLSVRRRVLPADAAGSISSAAVTAPPPPPAPPPRHLSAPALRPYLTANGAGAYVTATAPQLPVRRAAPEVTAAPNGEINLRKRPRTAAYNEPPPLPPPETAANNVNGHLTVSVPTLPPARAIPVTSMAKRQRPAEYAGSTSSSTRGSSSTGRARSIRPDPTCDDSDGYYIIHVNTDLVPGNCTAATGAQSGRVLTV